ncbi:hypothetical protein [Oryzobacter terrae]|uniref:hypothetical protein n=1 Tax=Oryzobacter terrae TaxID=1620385 RepID=UPI00366E864C
MTTPVAPAPVAERIAPLRAVVDTVLRDFGDLGYLAPKGVLEVPVTVGPVHRLRIELPRQFLHLQSVDLVTDDGSDATAGATVTASSWYGTYGDRFTPEALFDWDNPTGTVVHTEKDDPSWVEITFPSPLRLTAVRLRNVNGETATRAARLRVVARTRFRSHVVFDGGRRHKELRSVAATMPTGGDPDLEILRDVLVDTASGSYQKGKEKLGSADLDPALVTAFRGLANERLLPSRNLMWTIHGPCRSFRFWSDDEQLAYVRFAAEVVDVLRDLTPHVSLGFGSVLSVVRDRALIPHDDDLDLIIGFEPEEAATLADGLALVASFLTERGYAVRGNWSAHRQVARTPKGKHLDVFVGLFEGDAISWYPGTRGALDRDTMYPTAEAELLGVPCRIPARPETYLERLYGPGWVSPDPNFAHRWDRSAYADLAGGRPAPAPAPAATASPAPPAASPTG